MADGNTLPTPADSTGQPENGDVYSSGSGKCVGDIDTAEFASLKDWLHLQVLVGREWYVYQLVAIDKLGEEDAKRAS